MKTIIAGRTIIHPILGDVVVACSDFVERDEKTGKWGIELRVTPRELQTVCLSGAVRNIGENSVAVPINTNRQTTNTLTVKQGQGRETIIGDINLIFRKIEDEEIFDIVFEKDIRKYDQAVISLSGRIGGEDEVTPKLREWSAEVALKIWKPLNWNTIKDSVKWIEMAAANSLAAVLKIPESFLENLPVR